MKEREKATKNKFSIDDENYGILRGKFWRPVIYISLPEGHPDIGKKYYELEPEVNGGLTFGEDNVFGWDYGHYMNDFNFQLHIENALKYFKGRFAKRTKEVKE